MPLTAKLNNEPLTEFMYLLVKTAAYSAPAAAAGNLCTLMGCQAVKMLFEFDTELLLRLKTEKLYQSADSFVADGMEVLKDEEQQELNRLLDLIKTVPENACISEYCTAAENILEKLDIASKLGSAYKNGSAGYDAIKNYILAAGKLKDILSLLQSDYAAGGMLNKK